MVLTKAELIAALQKEVRILVHLAGKVDARSLDYRPTPKQRSTIELLKYLISMGPFLTRAIISGQFDGRAWGVEAEAAKDLSLADTIAAIAAQAEAYPALLSDVSDDDLRGDVEMFGTKSSRGASLVNLVICGYAAYRTQLFCYLQGVRPRRTEHHEPLGGDGRTGGVSAAPRATCAGSGYEGRPGSACRSWSMPSNR